MIFRNQLSLLLLETSHLSNGLLSSHCFLLYSVTFPSHCRPGGCHWLGHKAKEIKVSPQLIISKDYLEKLAVLSAPKTRMHPVAPPSSKTCGPLEDLCFYPLPLSKIISFQLSTQDDTPLSLKESAQLNPKLSSRARIGEASLEPACLEEHLWIKAECEV